MRKISQTYKIKDSDLFLDMSPRNYVLKVKDMPIEEQPRQKLIKQGPETLSLQELLSVILNVGNKNEDVAALSKRIVKEYGERSIFSEKNTEKLSRDLGVPIMKASQIVACGEIGRRLYERNNSGFVIVRTAREVFDYLVDMRKLPKEHLRGLYLNGHNRIVHDEVISIGTTNTSIVHPREVFRPAIEYNAAAVIIAHNHPSGNLAPSQQDVEITEQLVKAGKALGVHLLDHVIITKDSYASIKVNYF